MKSLPDLTKTRAALAALDVAGAAMDALPRSASNSEALEVAAAYDAAWRAVAEAYADETADRNRREDVLIYGKCLAGLKFIRRMAESK